MAATGLDLWEKLPFGQMKSEYMDVKKESSIMEEMKQADKEGCQKRDVYFQKTLEWL